MTIDFTVKVIAVENNVSIGLETILSHLTELYRNGDRELLTKEILEKYEDTFKQKYTPNTTFVIAEIIPTIKYMEDNQIKNDEIFKKSKAMWQALSESDEFKIEQLENSYTQTIALIVGIINAATQLNLLNSQRFLDFMDDLNKLSIDPTPTSDPINE